MRKLFWVVVCLASCGGAQKQNEDLLEHVRQFQEGIRWRKYDIAAEYLPARARERFIDTHDEIDKDLRIDDYELERVKVTDEHTRALVQVKFTWHLESRGIVHDTVLEESWERHGKIWRVIASRHKHGAQMPELFELGEPDAQPDAQGDDDGAPR
jgi:hypothetical protein